jgi:hypothetical protein
MLRTPSVADVKERTEDVMVGRTVQQARLPVAGTLDARLRFW